MDKMIRVSEATGMGDEWFILLLTIQTTPKIVQCGDMHSGSTFDCYAIDIVEERDSEVYERVEWIEMSIGEGFRQMFARTLSRIMDTDVELRMMLMSVIVMQMTGGTAELLDIDEEEQKFLEGLGYEVLHDGYGIYSAEVA